MAPVADNLPEHMRALRIEEFKADPPYKLREDIKTPGPPSPNQVLIEIYSAGYCHTEMMVAHGDFDDMSRKGLPLIPSHEPTGRIVALGTNAAKNAPGGPRSPNEALKIGDRVGALVFSDMCGQCQDCKDGSIKFCDDKDMLGVTDDGAFAQYMLADYRSVVVLPDSLSFDSAAPLFCAGATIYAAIQACELKEGQHVCIIGAGL